jgi:2-succinyl-6-hydroxy-2,4-cyclohexadiene-1-carboxylate synthase
MTTGQGRLVDAAGIRLFVAEEGDGPPVIVLHGFTGSGESMASVTDALRIRYRVVRVDLVGHGRSDAPHDSAEYTMERCTTQLASVVAATAEGPAHLIGYSMGGRVALSLAASRPDLIASLVLVGATPGLADAADQRARVEADDRLAERILEDGVEAFVDQWMALPLFASQQRLGDAALARARTQRLGNRPHALAASLRGMGTGSMPPLHDALPHIAQPVCLVVGEEDEKFSRIAREMARRLPAAQVIELPRAGHAAHLENPKAFKRVLRAFLRGAEIGIAPHTEPTGLSARP